MRALLSLVFVLVLGAARVHAQPSFWSILPPGNDGHVPTGGVQGPHASDQLDMYAALIRDAPGIGPDLTPYFKDAEIAPPAVPEHVVMPRPGVTISYDAFGVPHVVGATREDVFFGAGYATAASRLFFADVLRHMGRGRLSEFVGGVLGLDGTLGFDRTYYRVAGHSEAELEAIITEAAARNPERAPRVVADSQAFTDGMNAYIAEARLDASKRPAEYDLFGLELADWRLSDSAASGIAFCSVIGFCNGGGAEHRNLQLLQALLARHGDRTGAKLYDDLRAGDDPSAPTTTRRAFPYMVRKRIDADAVARFDAGSFVGYEPVDTSAVAPAFRFPSGMSNWLAIRGARADGGRPIMVGGPQTGYFTPQPLVELALQGGGIDVRGMTPAGVPYVVIGHTPDYAWTATSGGSDMTDVFVERLCTPTGGEPGSGTIFRDQCIPMLRRVDSWTAGTTAVTASVWRTMHGPVIGTATVDGEPVVLASQRTSFGLEVDSGAAYAQLNANEAQTAEQFRAAMAFNTGTLNWAYVSRDEIGYFHSGRYPRRAPGVDPDFPVWGNGTGEWQGVLDASEQPFDVDPKRGFMTSWNNKPARKWRASDGSHDYTSVYRSLLLDARVEPLVRRGRVTLAEAVAAMALAATTDLRGQEVYPDAIAFARKADDLRAYTDLLADWIERGAHRIDRDGDGRYDDGPAVALADAWWDPLVRALFDPQIEGLYDVLGVNFHDAPSGHLGSAFQGAFYGAVAKALRQARGRAVKGPYRALRCGGGGRAACAAAVQESLRTAVATLTAELGSADPAAWTVDVTNDDIRFSLGGLVATPAIPWQNRPTFQQAVQIRQ